MTGYGSGVASEEGYEARVEVRVVNHKQIDIRVRGHGLSTQTHARIDGACREGLERGRIDVNVQVACLAPSADEVLDANHAEVVWRALEGLSKQLAAPAPTLDTLLRVPGIVATSSSEQSERKQSTAIEAALGRALNSIRTMRTAEGAVLREDMEQRLKSLNNSLAAIKTAAPAMAEHFRTTLLRRIEQLAPEGYEMDPDRLEREVVLFAARADITEEIVRLESHLSQLASLFSEEEAVGKRIDFLLQEVSREVNTIASKVSDASIAQTVVHMKSEVARLREQSLNIL